jgi:hypothetical protein
MIQNHLVDRNGVVLQPGLPAAGGPGLIPKRDEEDWRIECHARDTDGFGSPFGPHSSLFLYRARTLWAASASFFIVC